MLHDNDTYPDPDTFNPERFDGVFADQPDPRNVVFGFGRRCVNATTGLRLILRALSVVYVPAVALPILVSGKLWLVSLLLSTSGKRGTFQV